MVAMNVWPTDGAAGSVATEAKWRKMARAYAPSGVIMDTGGELAPSLAGTNLTIAAGAAWVDGHYAELTGSQVLTVTANGLAVVRFDPAANSAELVYRDGVSTPAQSPSGIWELPVALISASALVDVRALLPPYGGPVIFPSSGQGRSLNIPNPEDGQLAYMADTGNLVQYLAIQSAWRAGPWHAPRGLVSPGVTAPASFTFSTTLSGCATQAYNLARGRNYMLHATGNVANGTVAGVLDTVWGGKASGTIIANKAECTFPTGTTNAGAGFHIAGLYQPAADESFGFKVYAQSNASATAQTVKDLNLWIEDVGANGAPPA